MGIIIIWLFMVLYSAVKRLSLPCEDVQHANMAPRRWKVPVWAAGCLSGCVSIVCFIEFWAVIESILIFQNNFIDQWVMIVYLVNKSFVHFIDNIFWSMGFKNETQADKVIMCIMLIIYFMLIICIMSIIFIMLIISFLG